MPDALAPIRIFCSYSHEDESLMEELRVHLSGLKRQGLISTWYDREIIAGTDWAKAIDTHLEAASLILLLVSADFLDSDYCYQIEMQRAMQRHKAKKACVIPIIVRPCDWTHAPFAQIQCLPRGRKPITTWDNRDVAWNDVTVGIRQAIEDLLNIQSLPEKSRRNQHYQRFKSIEGAIMRGYYDVAYQDVMNLSKEANAEMLKYEQAKLKYLEALIHLGGKRPSAQVLSVMRRVEELLYSASCLHNLFAYKKILAVLKQDFAHTGIQVRKYKEDANKLLHQADRLHLKAEDREILALFSSCLPQLYRDYSHQLSR